MIRWKGDYKGIVIENEALLTFILQKHFKTGTFSTFERQLYLYGFRKDSSCKEHSVYQHSAFTENSPINLTKIQGKQKIKKREGPVKVQTILGSHRLLKKDFADLKKKLKKIKSARENEKEKSLDLLKRNSLLMDKIKHQKEKSLESMKRVFSTIFKSKSSFKEGFWSRVKEFLQRFNIKEVFHDKNLEKPDQRAYYGILEFSLIYNRKIREQFFEFLKAEDECFFNQSLQHKNTEDGLVMSDDLKNDHYEVYSNLWERESEKEVSLIRDLSVLGDDNSNFNNQ